MKNVGLETLKPSTSKMENLEIYERAICIVSYKSKELVVNLQEIINQINLGYLTYALSEEEKTNRNYDYISHC